MFGILALLAGVLVFKTYSDCYTSGTPLPFLSNMKAWSDAESLHDYVKHHLRMNKYFISDLCDNGINIDDFDVDNLIEFSDNRLLYEIKNKSIVVNVIENDIFWKISEVMGNEENNCKEQE